MSRLLRALYQRRWWAVWMRNGRVWRKLAGPALLGNIGEPLLYLLALGIGLGSMVGSIDGLDYLTFLASGFVCASVMNTASFEGTYSVYTRMAVQETWVAMLYTPLDVEDVLIGEMLWGAAKSLLSAVIIILVATLLGAVDDWRILLMLPAIVVAGATFTAMSMVVSVLSRSYDFFLYYFTLFITPMFLFSGVFFPLSKMPVQVQAAAELLPLSHLLALVRPAMTGQPLQGVVIHLAVLLAYGLASLYLVTVLTRRRVLH